MSAIEGAALEAAASPSNFPVGRILLRDLRFGAAAWVLLAVAFFWLSWTGEFFGAFVMGILAFVYGGPVLFLVAAASLVSARPWVRIIRRVALQGLIVAVMSIPLPFLGHWAQELSILESQRRGDRIAELLEAHRRAHGAYPVSLGALEEQSKVRLPRPTMASEFKYLTREQATGYELTFGGAGSFFPHLWSRSSDRARWVNLGD